MELFNNKELVIMLSVFAILFLIIVILSIIDFFEARKEKKMIDKTLSIDLDKVKEGLEEHKVDEQTVTVIETTNVDEKEVFVENNEEMFRTTDFIPIKKNSNVVEIEEEKENKEEKIEEQFETLENNIVKEAFISPVGISYETPNKGYQSIYETYSVNNNELNAETSVETNLDIKNDIIEDNNLLFEEEEVIFKQPTVDKIVYEETVPNREMAVEMLLNVEKTMAREEKFEDTITNFEMEQEKTAIISLDELSKLSDNLYTSNEFNQYDDGDEPITIDEVIKKFNNSNISFENTATYTKFKKSSFDNELEEALREQE